MVATLSIHDARAEDTLHPLVRQQLEEATGAHGALDVARLLRAVSACYGASAALANDVLSQSAAQGPLPETASLPVEYLDGLSDGIVIFDPAGLVQTINSSARTLLGLHLDRPVARATGKPLAQCLHQGGHNGHRLAQAALAAGLDEPARLTEPMSFTCPLADGGMMLIDAQPFQSGGGMLVLRPANDVSEQTHQLRVAQQEYQSLFNNAVIGIYRSSLDGRHVRVNRVLAQIHGYDSPDAMLASLVDRANDHYVDPDRRQAIVSELDRHGQVTDFVSQIYRHKTRERIWISENAWTVLDPSGKPLFYEGTIVDATDRMAAEAEINHLAHHDHLTGLPNRFMLLKKLREALLRPDVAASVAVHCLDLDHFKDVNDTLGHQAGDRLLVAVGKRLRRSIKAGDILARLGGDEFTVLQFGVRSDDHVAALAGRIVATMNEPFLIGEHSVTVGVSVGVATFNGQEPTGMLRDADVALYEAKKRGRQTYAVYTQQMGSALQDRRALENDLRGAIDRGDFELFLQPIVDAQTGVAVVYEALLRWDHPTRGKVSPARFVPLAEESSLMLGLGDWVLNKTMEAAAHLKPGMRIAMNLSPLQLRDRGIVQRVRDAMARFDIQPDQLELEITETVIMTDDRRTLDTLNALRDMGLRLALDDFGTGHASLSYLQRFRFDKIKIDQSFVKRMVDDPISAAVVRAVTSLGHDLGALVVAEGVETEDQATALRREGCTLFQGYLFGQPANWQTVLGVQALA